MHASYNRCHAGRVTIEHGVLWRQRRACPIKPLVEEGLQLDFYVWRGHQGREQKGWEQQGQIEVEAPNAQA